MSKNIKKIFNSIESIIESKFDSSDPFQIFLAGMRFYQKLKNKDLSSSEQWKQIWKLNKLNLKELMRKIKNDFEEGKVKTQFCAICYEEDEENFCSLECGDIVCKSCFNKHLEVELKKHQLVYSCPKCRKEMP